MYRNIVSAVNALHNKGIIHRDIKAENILIGPGRIAKLCDFNTVLDSRERHMMWEEAEIGTLEYMAPEIHLTGRATERSDIFSLGVLGYKMITGELPFSDEQSESKHVKQKLRGRIVAPHKLRSECPKRLSNAIVKALEVKPARRYAECSILLREIEAVYHSYFGVGFQGKKVSSGSAPVVVL